MSDVAQGPGWWQASDGRWYPPETLAQALGRAPATDAAAPQAAAPQVTVPTTPDPAGSFPGAPVQAPAPLAAPGTGPLAGPGASHIPPDAPGAAGRPPGYPPYGPVPSPEMVAYPWPAYGASPTWQRTRVIGALLVLLGLAGVVWGIGELFAAMALNSSPVYPHDEQVGAWILTSGILLASLVTVVIGLVYRRG